MTDAQWIIIVMPDEPFQYMVFSEEPLVPKPLWYRVGKRAVRLWKVYAYLF